MRNIPQTIYNCLSLAEETKIPMMFLGNPGLAKTTAVRKWADDNNYKIIELQAANRTPDDILGSMAKIGDKFERLTPDWYNEMMYYKDQGFKTLLFCDEMSQASEWTQGATLTLIFDRRTDFKHTLPEDTLIVAASNYKGNLPGACNLISPTLNRFALINCMVEDAKEFVHTFLKEKKTQLNPLKAVRGSVDYSDELELIFDEVIDRADEFGIDFTNTQFDGIYDNEKEVYGFLSGRILDYLNTYCSAINKFDLNKNQEVVKEIVLGMAGEGTCSFKSEQQRLAFQSFLLTKIIGMLNKVQKETEVDVRDVIYSSNLNENIDSAFRFFEQNGYNTNVSIALNKLITKAFPTDPTEAHKRLSSQGVVKYANALLKAVISLSIYKESYDSHYKATYEKIIALYKPYLEEAAHVASDDTNKTVLRVANLKNSNEFKIIMKSPLGYFVIGSDLTDLASINASEIDSIYRYSAGTLIASQNI